MLEALISLHIPLCFVLLVPLQNPVLLGLLQKDAHGDTIRVELEVSGLFLRLAQKDCWILAIDYFRHVL